MTIRTVTLSPGFDHYVRVDTLDWERVGSVLSWTTRAGGKGLNASRLVTWLGGETVAYALVGVADEAAFVGLAARDGYDVVSVAIEQEMRHNLTLRDDTRDSRSRHAAGARFARVPPDAVERLFELLLRDIVPGDVVSFNGALPGSLSDDTWAGAAERIRSAGATLVADVQGRAMLELFATKAVHFAKPNEDEARLLLGRDGPSDPLDAAVVAVRAMRSLGVLDPVVSLGAMGAVHVQDASIVTSECPADDPSLQVGAGDAFVAGYCAALGGDGWSDASPISLALATASAHVDGHVGEDLRREAASRIGRTRTRTLADT